MNLGKGKQLVISILIEFNYAPRSNRICPMCVCVDREFGNILLLFHCFVLSLIKALSNLVVAVVVVVHLLLLMLLSSD